MNPTFKLAIATALALALGACSAEFTDLRREESQEAGNSASNNAGQTNNANAATNASTGNAANPGTGANAANSANNNSTTNASTSNNNAASETLIATGDFVNVDYDTVGTAQYWQLEDGSYEVRLSPDFATMGVPGPAIALSPRNPLGGAIEADELDLGALDTSSGEQSYALPGPPDDYTYAWIWCKPFGLDVAFAEMEFQQ